MRFIIIKELLHRIIKSESFSAFMTFFCTGSVLLITEVAAVNPRVKWCKLFQAQFKSFSRTQFRWEPPFPPQQQTFQVNLLMTVLFRFIISNLLVNKLRVRVHCWVSFESIEMLDMENLLRNVQVQLTCSTHSLNAFKTQWVEYNHPPTQLL